MALFLWKDWVKDSTITNASYGTDTVESIDVDNVKTRQLGNVYRQTFGSESPETMQVRLRLDLGEVKDINYLAILNHNLSAENTYRFSLGTFSGASDIYDSGGYSAPWTPGDYDPPNEFFPLDATYSARYAMVRITARNEDVIDIGRIIIGDAWTTNVSMEFGIGISDRGTKSKSRSGSTWSSERQKVRKMNIRAFGLTDADFYGTSADFDSFLDMDMAVGDTGELIVTPVNDSQHQRQRLSVYGTITNNGAIRVLNRTAGGYFTEKTFTVEEDR